MNEDSTESESASGSTRESAENGSTHSSKLRTTLIEAKVNAFIEETGTAKWKDLKERLGLIQLKR